MNQKDMSGMINFCKFMNSCLMSEAPSVAAFQIVLPKRFFLSKLTHGLSVGAESVEAEIAVLAGGLAVT